MIKIIVAALLILIVAFCVGLAVLYSQVPRYKKYWQKRSAQKSPQDAILYVALGDSTAQGIGATHPTKGYVGLIAQALGDTYKRPVHVVNISKSGAKLIDCINEQLPQLKNIEPDVITIEIGANDMIDFDSERFRRETQQVMTLLPKTAIISDIPYFGGSRHFGLEQHVIQANSIMEELRISYDFDLAPVHAKTQQDDSVMTFAIDVFHPNNRGYRNWFNAFWPLIKEQMLHESR